MATQILLPPSRIVEGNVYKSSNIGLNGQIKAKPEFYFALAIAKSEPRLGEVFGAFLREAQTGYASNQHILARIGNQINFNSGFAWKIADGDAPDRRERPGQAGCWIFKVKTTWDVKVVDAQNIPINPILLRTGYWCDVRVDMKPNGKIDHTAGLYVNPVFVRHLFPGFGDEIFPGPQADKVMGAAPSQLPPGAQPARQGAPGVQPGSPGSPGPGVGTTYPQQAAPGAPHVGYQAPAGQASHQAPGGWQAPQVNPQQNPASAVPQPTTYPQTNSGTPSQYAGPAATTGPSNPTPTHQAPGGWQAPQVNPTPNAMSAGAPQGPGSTPPAQYAPNATTYPSEGPTHQPPAHASGPAAAGPGPAAAVPGGAHYTPAQPASPTAYPSNPVSGFAHGNPQA